MNRKQICGAIMLMMAFVCMAVMLPQMRVGAAAAYEWVDSPEYGTLSNGSTGYYLKDNVLYKYNYKSKKAKKLKALSKKWDVYITAVYGGNVYLTSENFDQWSLKTYIYNTKSKKLKYTKKKCSIMSNYGKYALTRDDFTSDVSPVGVSIYQLTRSGMKKLKTLTKHGMTAHFINDSIYYINYPLDAGEEPSMRQMEIYICDLDGGNAELVTTITDPSEYGYVQVMELNAGHCDLMMSDGEYRFIFDSKHLEKLKY